jgi:hypothetical protein
LFSRPSELAWGEAWEADATEAESGSAALAGSRWRFSIRKPRRVGEGLELMNKALPFKSGF